MQDFNWNDLRFFIAMARTGNAAEAARLLHVDHNTVRRRVAALENVLNTRLFDRRNDLHALTIAGQQLMRLADQVEGLTLKIPMAVGGMDSTVAGTVRLGVTDGMGTMFIAPRLAQLTAAYPDITIELIVKPRDFNLAKREADIAIYIDRPVQGPIIIRKMGSTVLRLYSSSDYLDRNAPINSLSDLVGHTFINGMDELDFGRSLARAIGSDDIINPRIRCTSSVAQAKAAAYGAGLCILSRFIAEREGLVPVLPDLFEVHREVWLGYHSDLKDLASIRAVSNFFISAFAEEPEGFS